MANAPLLLPDSHLSLAPARRNALNGFSIRMVVGRADPKEQCQRRLISLEYRAWQCSGWEKR